MPRRGSSTDEYTDEYTGGEYQVDQPEQMQDGDQAGEMHEGDPTEPSDDDKATAAALAAIESYSEAPPDLVKATTPVRKRNELQLAMDNVAAKVYQAWVERDRPTAWAKLPVITYYLDPEQVPAWKAMIRKACNVIEPDGDDASGVRTRFGREFVLTEEQAAKIGRPDDAGKTVLSWTAIDKRKTNRTNGDASTAEASNDD